MDRRSLLKLIASGLVGTALDVDKLLWIPGQKKIFLPPVLHRLSMSQIVAMELERIVPHIQNMFDRDDTFYRAIREGHVISSRPLRIPLIIRPGALDD